MFCEQCGAELEADARFCAMCGRQVEKDGGADVGLPKSISDLRIGVLKKGVIPALLVVLGLGGVLFWMFREESKTELSRSKAEKLIVEHEKFPLPGIVGMFTDAYAMTRNVDDTVIKALQDEGLIEHRPEQKYKEFKLTGKGEIFLIGDTSRNPLFVKGCEIKFLKVTGITTAEIGFKGANVEYEWTFDNPTPFASLGWHGHSSTLPSYSRRHSGKSRFPCRDEIGVPRQGMITFRLYDDGWRPDV